jgi:hypothetical protein
MCNTNPKTGGKLKWHMTGVSYFWCLCMPTYNSVQHVLTKWLTWRMSFASTWVHSWFFVRSVLLIFLVVWICFVCFVCLHLVCCVSNVASVSGMSILDYHFGLSLTLALSGIENECYAFLFSRYLMLSATAWKCLIKQIYINLSAFYRFLE